MGRVWREILDRRRDELAAACVPDGDGSSTPYESLLDALAADPSAALVEGILPLANAGDAEVLAAVHRLRDALVDRLPEDATDDRSEIRRRADVLALELLAERERRRETLRLLARAEDAASAQLARLQALGQLTAAVAHTFNNLLTVVAGYASALETSPRLDGLERRAIDRIVTAAEQAASLTETLVRSTRGDPPRVREVQMLAFLLEARDILGSMVGRSIQLEVLAQQDLPRVAVDPARLHEAVLYLAANARAAMPAGGSLILSAFLDAENEGTEDSPRAVILEVRDSGEGIATTALPRVFEPGFTTRPDAAGLGCSQVRAIVEQWGGAAEIESRPGDGTRVLLRLPVA